jgi:hypothetical protein
MSSNLCISNILKRPSHRRNFTIAIAVILLFISKQSLSIEADLSSADISAKTLKAKHVELNSQLLKNQFKRELYLLSSESQNDLQGEIYAVVDYPFLSFNNALNNPDNWCDALILHVNIKYCQATGNKSNKILKVNIGKKIEQPLTQTFGVKFNYHEVVETPEYFAVELKAAKGPMSTHDYRILLEAIPIKNGRTFLHFTYAYAFGFAGRVAMQAYLATGGLNKVGFTSNGLLSNGQPAYIKGVRGVVERNTMRYYLAIDAYLFGLNSPPEGQLDRRLQKWFGSTEEYATQLHEVELVDYINMKHREYLRQQIEL